jgi:squalene-associated FAD-dependent desaturase
VRERSFSDVIVVGGGLAGLTCGVALADAGVRVAVLEAAPDPGGRARSWRHVPSGDVVDIGPHVVHSEYANFMKLLRRLGTDSWITWQPGKLITLATSKGLHPLRHRKLPTPFSLFPDMLRAPEVNFRDTLSNMRITRTALRFTEAEVGELDERSGLEVLREHGVSEAMIDWFWRLASMTVMNVPLERCSAAALLRVHSQLIGHRDLHFGFPAVGLSELYVDQAASAIEQAGGTVLVNNEVVHIDQARDGGHRVITQRGDHLRCRRLVLAIPPPALATLNPALGDARAFEPSPYKSVYLWFDRPVVDERFWTLLWNPRRLNYDFYDLARIRPEVKGGVSLIASNIIYSHRTAGMSDEAIVAATREELAMVAPQAREARLLHSDVHHVPMAIPCPYVGTEARRPRTVTAIPGLFLAGDWVRTRLPCSMESAVRSGYLAAEACLAELGQSEPIAEAPRSNDGLAGWMQPGKSHGTRDSARP